MNRITLPQTILFCPLHWGLGHIARDVPLIKEFLKHGHRVVVAASPTLVAWIKTEIPEIETTYFYGPDIRYSKNKLLFLSLLNQLPGLLSWPRKERKRTAELVVKYKPDLIVSDNRYGARHPNVYSVIITHQLMVKMTSWLKWLEMPLHHLIKTLIRQFNECWIPDFSAEHSLAGDLVHKYPYPSNSRLIGPLSRFDDITLQNKKIPVPVEHSIFAIISGPEPQRTIFEEKIRTLLRNYRGIVTIAKGSGSHKQLKQTEDEQLRVYDHLTKNEMLKNIYSHNTILSRSGYSTIMDMYFIKKSIWLSPTPGQTEQMYLANYHHKKGHQRVDQNLLSLILTSSPKDSGNKETEKGKEKFREILHSIFINPSLSPKNNISSQKLNHSWENKKPY